MTIQTEDELKKVTGLIPSTEDNIGLRCSSKSSNSEPFIYEPTPKLNLTNIGLDFGME